MTIHITNNKAILAIPLVARATHVLIRDLCCGKLAYQAKNHKALAQSFPKVNEKLVVFS